MSANPERRAWFAAVAFAWRAINDDSPRSLNLAAIFAALALVAVATDTAVDAASSEQMLTVNRAHSIVYSQQQSTLPLFAT